jgi:hypothetical protein
LFVPDDFQHKVKTNNISHEQKDTASEQASKQAVNNNNNHMLLSHA